MLIVAKIWKAIHDELKMVRIIKCRSCGRRLFDVSVIGKIEMRCPKCGKIVSVDIAVDTKRNVRMTQKLHNGYLVMATHD